MPKNRPEHTSRVEVRLPARLLEEVREAAKRDRLPLSGWIRETLDRRANEKQPVTVRTYTGYEKFDERGRRTLQSYVNDVPAGEPLQGGSQFFQDHEFDRQKARAELRNWLHRWGRKIPLQQFCRLTAAEIRLTEKLLAKFDQQ